MNTPTTFGSEELGFTNDRICELLFIQSFY